MGGGPRTADYARHCQSLVPGAAPILRPFPGYEEMMRIATSNHVPQAALAEVTAWLVEVAAGLASSGPMTRRPIAVEETILRQGGCIETPVLFGVGDRLAGVLCEPLHGPVSDRAVLVDQYRGRSACGHRGASAWRQRDAWRRKASPRCASTLPGWAIAASRATRTAMSTRSIAAPISRRRSTCCRLVATAVLVPPGICTGAYHILHAAVQDTRIGLLMLIHLVTFEWRRGRRA